MAVIKVRNSDGTITEITSLKGKDGYTPIAGVDYPTYYNTTTTIPANAWNNNTHLATVEVNGVTANNFVLVAPAADSRVLYAETEIYCIDQNDSGVLTFSCFEVPTKDVNINIVIFGSLNNNN